MNAAVHGRFSGPASQGSYEAPACSMPIRQPGSLAIVRRPSAESRARGAPSAGEEEMMITRMAAVSVLGLSLVASLGACQGQYGQKETIGTLGGAALGGFVGSQ